MTIAGITAGALSEVEHGRQLRRALIASTVGTTIEWYDFLLYGQLTGLVFGKLFSLNRIRWSACCKRSPSFLSDFSAGPSGRRSLDESGPRIGRLHTIGSF
jgi:hypothetical protein